MRKSLPYIAGLSLILVILNACAPQKPALQSIRDSGVLHVLTSNDPTTYYIGANGPEGLEYDLVKAFADHLGVSLKISTDNNIENILTKVRNGEADFAAAGIVITPERTKTVNFSDSYQTITQQLVYHRNNPRPKNIRDTQTGNFEVMSKSNHVEKLNELTKHHPDLNWHENQDTSSAELLTFVAGRLIDYTIADSNVVLLTRRFHPELEVAFNVSEPQNLAWAFSKTGDNSLYIEANKFFAAYKKSGQLAQLLKQHYEYARNYDYAGTTTYLGHVRYRLPRYQEMFERAAQHNQLDWQLLAAVAYQESHWNPRAISPTGVKGMMMLTKVTASDLGIGDRTIAAQSIKGGAQYINELYKRFPDVVDEQERLWFTLAAYNVGIGHVNDARLLTNSRGGDANKWVDVEENLQLLRRKHWYKLTRYGFARGKEAVKYVENIRSYYDILRWHLAKEESDSLQLQKVAFLSP